MRAAAAKVTRAPLESDAIVAPAASGRRPAPLMRLASAAAAACFCVAQLIRTAAATCIDNYTCEQLVVVVVVRAQARSDDNNMISCKDTRRSRRQQTSSLSGLAHLGKQASTQTPLALCARIRLRLFGGGLVACTRDALQTIIRAYVCMYVRSC